MTGKSPYKEIEHALLEAPKDVMETFLMYSVDNLSYKCRWLLPMIAIYRLLRCDKFRLTIKAGIGLPFMWFNSPSTLENQRFNVSFSTLRCVKKMASLSFKARSIDRPAYSFETSPIHTDLLSSDPVDKMHCPILQRRYSGYPTIIILMLTFSLVTFQAHRVSLIVMIFNIVVRAVISNSCIYYTGYLFGLSFLNFYTVETILIACSSSRPVTPVPKYSRY